MFVKFNLLKTNHGEIAVDTSWLFWENSKSGNIYHPLGRAWDTAVVKREKKGLAFVGPIACYSLAFSLYCACNNSQKWVYSITLVFPELKALPKSCRHQEPGVEPALLGPCALFMLTYLGLIPSLSTYSLPRPSQASVVRKTHP